jgi:hypothetical protein
MISPTNNSPNTLKPIINDTGDAKKIKKHAADRPQDPQKLQKSASNELPIAKASLGNSVDMKA